MIPRIKFVFVLFILIQLCMYPPLTASATEGENNFLDMDLESLMKIQVTSAGRKTQNLGDVPAAIYVITQEDIRNSAAVSVPQVLRLVPGLQVAQINSSQWAITSRGFNGLFANKLLVQLDGRTLYTPTYSGVYWDLQNVMLEDIERIEVIRGPGATLWGANAVNGVINIISKQSSDTLGTLVSAGSGNHEKALISARHGVQLYDNAYGRFYIQHNSRDSLVQKNDQRDANDDWKITKGGFRLDGNVGVSDSWTFQGDIFHGDNNQLVDVLIPTFPYSIEVEDAYDNDGFNLLTRWEHSFSKTNKIQTQIYYDYTKRGEKNFIEQKTGIFDFDFSHHLTAGEIHDIIWGVGYRSNDDTFKNTFAVSITPDTLQTDLYSAFLQDEIEIITDKVWLTVGSKIEHNDFTGLEIQPNIRGLWRASEHHSYWASIARAVRTPSRIEDGGKILVGVIPPYQPGGTPQPFGLTGTNNFESENLIAYEAGYRFSKSRQFSIDLSLFYNDYDELQTYFASQGIDTFFVNAMEGESYGLEITTKWTPAEWLETELSYSYIELNMSDKDNTAFSSEGLTEQSSPQHQISASSLAKITKNVDFNIWLRYVDQIQRSSGTYFIQSYVDSYWNLDLNIIWTIKQGLELALVGQNLINSDRVEIVAEGYLRPTEVGQSIYAKLTWQF